jgi:mannose-6-phosphate isomerase
LAGLRQFPLLVKFLDAQQTLSVQVHPNDEQGRRLVHDNGKTEAWVIVAAEPGSWIYAGLRPGVTRAEFGLAIDQGSVESCLHRFEARPGQCVFIPAGTVHAIGAGIVLAEIQQMSDATFRIFDWGRFGTDGKPRPLHRDFALESIDFDAGPVNPVASTLEPIPDGYIEPLVHCPYFAFDRWQIHNPAAFETRDRFVILLGLGGTASVRAGGSTRELPFGRTLLLPASLGTYTVSPPPGSSATILRCWVP